MILTRNSIIEYCIWGPRTQFKCVYFEKRPTVLQNCRGPFDNDIMCKFWLFFTPDCLEIILEKPLTIIALAYQKGSNIKSLIFRFMRGAVIRAPDAVIRAHMPLLGHFRFSRFSNFQKITISFKNLCMKYSNLTSNHIFWWQSGIRHVSA